MTKEETEKIKNIEKKMLKNAIKNIKSWSEDAYFAGGVTTTEDSTKAIEDLKMAKLMNKVEKVVSTTKLTNLIKKLSNVAQYQNMYSDIDKLDKTVDSLKKVA